jgi:hypothetical protein
MSSLENNPSDQDQVEIRKLRFEDIARSGFLDFKKVEIRRSGFLDFSRSGRSGSGRDQEIKPPLLSSQ